MMQFRVVKGNLITILGDAADGRYTVFGYQRQTTDASEVEGDKRQVQLFYNAGDFPRDKAALTGPTQHDIEYRVQLKVSAEAKGNLAVINNENSSDAQVAVAIDEIQTAADRADESIDEFFDIIYQILMDGLNVDLGTSGPPYVVSSRWVGSMKKGDPVPQGEYVVLTGNVEFSCQAIEQITGDTGTPAGDDAFNITDDIAGDDNEQTGVIVGKTPAG